MPRMPAPPSESEGLNLVLEHPFSKEGLVRTGPLNSSSRYIEPPLQSALPDKKIEITAEPNRPGVIKVTERHGRQHEKMLIHDGELDR